MHLRVLLDERGMTADELAHALGLQGATVRYWLRGESFPDLETLVVLGKALSLDDYRQVLPPL